MQPGLAELKHDGPLLSQEQMCKVYEGKNRNILPCKWDDLTCAYSRRSFLWLAQPLALIMGICRC